MKSKLINTKKTKISKWVTLVEKKVLTNIGNEEYFHSIDQYDYVSILALTQDNKVPLVKQFRPAINKISLELPGGLLDRKDEPPECAARRELYEETGFESQRDLIYLGCRRFFFYFLRKFLKLILYLKFFHQKKKIHHH